MATSSAPSVDAQSFGAQPFGAESREAQRARLRRREELLRQRAAERGWRERLLTRRTAYTQARRDWVRHLLER